MLCGAGLQVVVADGMIWCWVAGAGFGNGDWRDRDEGSAMEIGETEMGDGDER